MKKQSYDLEERLLEYSVRITKTVEQLPNTGAGKHVAGQLLRSATSLYPIYGEATTAEFQKDFAYKHRISLTEIDVECSVLDVCFFIRFWMFHALA